MGATKESRLQIETDVDPAQLRERLRGWAPWRYAVDFSNGVSTTEFEHDEFFVDEPLAKFGRFREQLPDGLEGGQALDVGCNIGHNSLHLHEHYGMRVTGVDASARNIEVARYFAELAGADDIQFQRADANRFVSDERFDLILHLTTLMFLRDPFLALRNTVAMLRPEGGCLVLETETYRDPDGDETLCKFHPHSGPDDQGKQWWSLGKAAIENMLWSAGCSRVEFVEDWQFKERLYRTFVIAQRA